ncbi:MAG: aquaporin [Candidatus Dormibacteraceae bacterium]
MRRGRRPRRRQGQARPGRAAARDPAPGVASAAPRTPHHPPPGGRARPVHHRHQRGYAISPARDFGPRLFASVAGWGQTALPGNYGNVDWYLWIPIVGPLAGGIIGVIVYDFFVRNVLISRGAKEGIDNT